MLTYWRELASKPNDVGLIVKLSQEKTEFGKSNNLCYYKYTSAHKYQIVY